MKATILIENCTLFNLILFSRQPNRRSKVQDIWKKKKSWDCKKCKKKSLQSEDRHGTSERIAPQTRPRKLCKPLDRRESSAHQISQWVSRRRRYKLRAEAAGLRSWVMDFFGGKSGPVGPKQEIYQWSKNMDQKQEGTQKVNFELRDLECQAPPLLKFPPHFFDAKMSHQFLIITREWIFSYSLISMFLLNNLQHLHAFATLSVSLGYIGHQESLDLVLCNVRCVILF